MNHLGREYTWCALKQARTPETGFCQLPLLHKTQIQAQIVPVEKADTWLLHPALRVYIQFSFTFQILRSRWTYNDLFNVSSLRQNNQTTNGLGNRISKIFVTLPQELFFAHCLPLFSNGSIRPERKDFGREEWCSYVFLRAGKRINQIKSMLGFYPFSAEGYFHTSVSSSSESWSLSPSLAT